MNRSIEIAAVLFSARNTAHNLQGLPFHVYLSFSLVLWYVNLNQGSLE